MLFKRTVKMAALLVCMVGMVFGITAGINAQDETQAKIENAMSAAPMSIAKDATIMDFPSDPTQPFIELRKGTNKWTCFPDWPVSPGNDPQCLDEMWTKWNDAFAAGKDPEVTALGIAYMLQGGSDASNIDPLAMEPAAGEDWLTTPPHIMILLPGKLDTALYSTDFNSGGSWIMWAGTPYEHIMVPVADGEHNH